MLNVYNDRFLRKLFKGLKGVAQIVASRLVCLIESAMDHVNHTNNGVYKLF